MPNRRRFILYSLLGTAGLLVGSVGINNKIYFFEVAIRNILTENLEGLRVSAQDIEAYAREVADKNELYISFANIQLICLYQVYGVRSFLPFNERYNGLRSDITTNFLLSTDFFYNKMDEQRDIKYTGTVYNVYRSGCVNPFSGLFYKV